MTPVPALAQLGCLLAYAALLGQGGFPAYDPFSRTGDLGAGTRAARPAARGRSARLLAGRGRRPRGPGAAPPRSPPGGLAYASALPALLNDDAEPGSQLRHLGRDPQ
ncbi:hypothetical protein [Terrabacter ginsenosidimutans]|uniref:hypothetical protein n=1 Tax=Terrabacter ginsenosidimutans TaxID=490575 RepID=UPI0031E5172B